MGGVKVPKSDATARWLIARLDEKVLKQNAATSQTMSLREFIESEDFAAPYLRASAGSGPMMTNVAWAIVDAIDGRPITTLTEEQHLRIFGCALGTLTPKRARKYLISAGGRSGKTSRFLAVVAVWCAWTVPLPTLAPGEEAFAFLSAPTKPLSNRVIKFCIGVITMSPTLRASLAKDPGAESVKLKRPDGRVVSVESSAKGKLSGRGGTCVFYGVDEAEFFLDTDAQDLEEQIKGAEQRVVPGGMVGIVSTPFVEGEGEMQRTLVRERGKHVGALCMERISTRELNVLWDPTGEIERDMRAKPGGDANVAREIYAIPYPKGTKRFFDLGQLRRAAERKSDPNARHVSTGAGSDLGMRRDGCALVLVRRYANGMFSVPRIKIERPTAGPLIPSVVCSSFASEAREYGAAAVGADGVYAETYREHLAHNGLALLDAPTGREGKVGMFLAALQIIATDRLALGDLPEAEREDLIDQLSRITERKLPGGSTEIIIPRRTVRTEAEAAQATTDHCDGAAALVIALWAAGAGAGVEREAGGRAVSIPQEFPQQQKPPAPPQVRGVSMALAPKIRGGWRR